MKDEISAAVTFVTNLVGKNEGLNTDQVEIFRQSLLAVLTERFKGHWFPEKPFKGQAYRCIRVNETEPRDPVLEKAAEMCGLQYENLNLPVELTIWVDPQEVCCRFGEHEGSYCTVASFINKNKENFSEKRRPELHSRLPLQNQEVLGCNKKQKSHHKRHLSNRNAFNQQNVLKEYCFEWNPPLHLPFSQDMLLRPRKHFRHDRFHHQRK